jgi:hypothetical protein
MKTSPVLSKVHTFADDLNKARLRRGPVTATPVVSTPPVVAKKTATTPTIPTPIAVPTPTPKKVATTVVTPTATPKEIPVIAPKSQVTVTAPVVTVAAPKVATPTVAAPVKITTGATRDASYPATIITDRKRNRFNLTSELTKSLSDWWNKKLKSINDAKKPVYTVPTAERRKGVITAATSMTARSTTTDYNEVVARLKSEQDKTSAATAIPATPHTVTPTATNVVATTTAAWETAHTVSLDTEADTTPRETPAIASVDVEEVIAVAPSTPIVATPTSTATTVATTPKLPERKPVPIAPITPIIPTIEPVVATVAPINPAPVLEEAWEEIPRVTSPTEIVEVGTAERQPYISAVRVEYYRDQKNSRYQVEETEDEQEDTLYEDETIDDEAEENATDGIYATQDDDEVPADTSEATFTPLAATHEMDVVTLPVVHQTSVLAKAFPKITPIIPTVPVEISRTKLPTPPATPQPQPLAATQPLSAVTLMREEALPTLPTNIRSTDGGVQARREALALQPPAQKSTRRLFPWHLAPYIVVASFICITVGTITYFMLSGTAGETQNQTASDLPVSPTDISNNTPDLSTAIGSAVVQVRSTSQSSLYDALLTAMTSDDSYRIITVLEAESALPLPTRELLTRLNWNLTTDFIQNVTIATIATYRGAPVLLLTIDEESKARGGMFLWEKTLSSDLSPWFGQPVRATTTTSRTDSSFTDSTVGTHDVRILKEETGKERITYGIVNTRSILITTDTTSFLNVADTYVAQ